MGLRVAGGVRLAVLGGLLLLPMGWSGRALGPTVYVFLVHPDSEGPRVGNAVLGHAAAVGITLPARLPPIRAVTARQD